MVDSATARLAALLLAAIEAGRRFPVAAAGCAAVTLGLYLRLHDGTGPAWSQLVIEWLLRAGSAFLVGGALAGLIAQARAWPRYLNLGGTLALGLAVAAHGFWFASDTSQLLLIGGLLVGLLVWPTAAARHGDDASWGYALELSGQAAFALAVALIAWMGLGLLLTLLSVLLAVDVPPTAHVDVALLTFGLIAPLLFLGAAPDPATFGASLRVPRWLDLFMIWVCVPLALAYLAIFQLYVLRIALAWDLPDGQIAWFTIGIAGLGALAHWLAYPDRAEGAAWVRVYYRLFYPALVPILIVFALAIWQRIDAYGVTESRYVLCLLLLWLALMATLSVRARWYRPAYAPGVLALLLVVASIGPWNPTAVALRSQLDRLHDLLVEGGLVRDGQAASETSSLDPAQVKSVQSILRFLIDRDAQARLAPLFAEPPAWIDDRPSSHRARAQLVRAILADLGVAVTADQLDERPDRFTNPSFGPGLAVDIAGFGGAAWLRIDAGRVEPRVLETNRGRFAITFDPPSQSLVVTAPDASTIRLPLRAVAVAWAEQAPRTAIHFTIERSTAHHRARLIVGRLVGSWRNGSDDYVVAMLEALLLVA